VTVPEQVEQHDPEGVDYGWVMQVTFVATIVVGAPIVALAALFVTLPTWSARAGFAIRVGAGVWVVTAFAVYLYERSRLAGDG
jgi:membrane protein YdbS with pleckstrin-like domain